MPSSTPIFSRSPKLSTISQPYSIAKAISAISTSVAFLRPMYCDSTPSGKRISAPAMIGTDSISPFCAGDRPYASLMNGAIAPLSTQMQHENAKYRNDAANVGMCPARRKLWVAVDIDGGSVRETNSKDQTAAPCGVRPRWHRQGVAVGVMTRLQRA